MIETTFNIFDVAVLGVIALSALISFFRGFVREFLSLGAWVGALIITLYSFPKVAAMIAPHVGSAMIASGLASVGTFMVSLIAIGLFTSMLMKLMKSGSDIGLFDNALGLGFGAARGALLVSVGYIILRMVITPASYEENVEPATTRPMVEKGALLLTKLAPDYLREISPLADEVKDELDANLEDDAAMEEKIEDFKDAVTEDDKKISDPNVGWDSMDKLQKMIEEKSSE